LMNWEENLFWLMVQSPLFEHSDSPHFTINNK
jgi:hypothetical protein